MRGIKNNLIKFVALTVVLIASITTTVMMKSFAVDLEVNQTTDVENNVGKTVASYSAKFTIDAGGFQSYFHDKAFTALSTNHAIYCMKHGKDLFDQHKRCKLIRDHEETIDMDSKISFEFGGNPSPTEHRFKDYMDASEGGNRKTDSNIRYKVTGTGLRSISTNWGTFTGNVIPYAATFENSGNPYENPGQLAMWEHTGNNGDARCNNDLYKAGYSVDALESEIKAHGDQPKVTAEKKDSNTGSGTILEGNNYVIGPFKMSDYAYVGSKYVEPYSGKNVATQKDLVGGIASGYVTLNNGTKLKFGEQVTVRYITPGDNNRSASGATSSYYTDMSGNRLNLSYVDGKMMLNGSEEVTIVYDNNGYRLKRINGGDISIKLVQTGSEEYWGVPKNYPYPFPNSTFYLVIPRSACGNATTLNTFNFEYRKTRADGSGWIANGEFVRTDFSRIDTKNKGCSDYYAECGGYHGSGGSTIHRSPLGGYHSTTHSHYHTCDDYNHGHGCDRYNHPNCKHNCGASCEKNGCNHTCTSRCYEKIPGCHCSCPGHNCTHTVNLYFTCNHGRGHIDCRHFTWLGKSYKQIPQPLLGVGNANVQVTEDPRSSTVNVRLTTDLTINKYITKVEHVGETGVIYGENSNRSRANNSGHTSDWKKNNTVKAERGDKVTYHIDIINKQDQKVSFQIKDILPKQSADQTFNPSINNWLEVDGNQTKRIKVTLRTTANTGIWENYTEIITKNSGNVDYNRTDYAPSDNRHNGPVVNVAELNGGILKDSDFYQIKEYNVNIEKYIYDVEHNQENIKISNIDTTLGATNQRSITKGVTEEAKKANPVYAEYGDTITYKIIVYNTTNKYNSSIDNKGAPYWKPDKVYVDIEDTLPKKYSKLDITVSGTGVPGNKSHTISKTDSSTNGGKFTIKNLMVPANSTRTITVKLTVDEYTKGTVEENSVKFIGKMRNINRGPNPSSSVDDKYDVIKNNPIRTETKDYYKINNYNTFIDKYIYKYDEKIQKENNGNTFTNDGLITNDDGTLKTSRMNTNAQYSSLSDGNVNDKVREPNNKDKYKKEHPVSAEKYETIEYAIKVSNEATTVNKSLSSGNKPATQVRTTKVTDKMEVGLTQKSVKAIMYNADGSPCTRYNGDGSVGVAISAPMPISENGRNYNKYEYNLGNETILNPGEYIIFYVTVEVTESNMYLNDLENKADLTVLTNINHYNTTNREVRNPKHDENISKQEETKEYIRMKDLVIAGNVWVDFDRDGFMTDKDVDPTKQAYHNVNQDGRKKDVRVHLYLSDGTLLRTTKTDANGLYTFGRDENLGWYGTYNHDTGFSSGTTYQRVDKADNKDANGNYTANSKYLSYYIEYEYDGVVYKSTEFYAGSDGKKHLKDDGSFAEEYLIDSNAAEFKDVRESFNTKYEYISYDVAYDLGFNKTNDLVFDKTGHTSQLMEDNSRLMTARSFINVPSNKNDANSTNYLWLYPFGGSQNNTKPETEYLKHINLGLELREDVDIALTKDVYKVKTTVDGEEMEYNYNQNNGLNGDIEPNQNNQYLQNYIITKPYGLELYESDYKYRFEQYKAAAVQKYKGINGESELNVEVTYRITVDNKSVTDDDSVNAPGKNPPVTDTKLDVKIHEILDLYDKNFVQIQFDKNGNMAADANPVVGSPNTVVVKNKNADGFLVDKPIKIAEAWYFKEASEAGNAANGTKYSVENPNDVALGAKPIYKEDPSGNYVKVDLTLSSISSRGTQGKYSEKDNNFEADGYNTVYIRGMENEIIHEGEDLDIYVKYVLDKDALEVGITNEHYEETKSSSSNSNSNTEQKPNGSTTTEEESGTSTVEKTTILERSLKIAEKTASEFKDRFGRGTENIAQINAYSVWYTDGKPASLVDMDSNAGNIGIKNDSTGVIPGSAGYSESNTSADNVDYYEDTTYKTGIEIVAEATENTKEKITEIYKKNNIVVEVQNSPDIMRTISGTVWDDSRTDTLGDGGETQYIGDGNYDSNEIKSNDAKENENVRLNYKDDSVTEEKDIKVRNARAEFVEIVDIPVLDENGNYVKDANNNNSVHYYEEILSDVTWEQIQHTRTDTEGNYELRGFVPGRYVVRFTYGDTVEANNGAQSYDSKLEAQNDMLIFNGQDYKSTRYTTELSDSETDIDEIIRQLEVKNKSDARDDEIRRLEVNRYSEIMTNELAEILKGVANGTELTERSEANGPEELKALTDNTYMNAETVEFIVRTEKLTTEQTSKYIVKTNVDLGNGNIQDVADEIYYKELEAMHYVDNNARDFNIENVDFGIEYRPESQISLVKEIDEMKITTEDGEVLADLFFYTEGEGEEATHHLDMEKSIGLDLVQFISNDYTSLLSGLTTEDIQGFVYLQIDDDILQGSKIEITYKFKAQNNSEVDRITENLDDIRYKENKVTIDLINAYNSKGSNIVDTHYTASGTARNIIFTDTYGLDNNKDLYRNMRKVITNEKDENNKAAGDGGYFGRYVGYAYYTGKDTNLDTISSLKFDKILDYIDTDLEFEQETNNNNLINRYWTRNTAPELVDHVYSLREYRNADEVGGGIKLTNVNGIEYKNLVVSVDDRVVDIGDPNDKNPVNNQDLSRFLVPEVTDTDQVTNKNSMGIVYLPVSKVVSAEADTEDMTYENIAEIIQFTTLTGRRTNFATTIGNADVKTTKPDSGIGSEEFITASYESDTAATETITLTPPTGLMKNRRVIVDVVDTAKTSVIVIIIIVAVVAIAIIVTKVTITKIKKRRYK